MARNSVEMPVKSTAAILKNSAPVSDGVPQVSGIDFDRHMDQDISVNDLLSGMESMGFQASESPLALLWAYPS